MTDKRTMALAAAVVILCSLPTAVQAQNKSRRTLERENAALAAKVDSLMFLLEEYEGFEKEMAEEGPGSPAEEDMHGRGILGSGLSAEDYNDAVTDSLITILHRRQDERYTLTEYNMDSVVFESATSDEVYLKRIEKMHAYITLPYNEKVKNYMILYAEKMPAKMGRMLGLAKYYMPIFEETLNRYGLPEELKYMAVIESALNPVATSRAGARGMWQFIYRTAKQYGLEINTYVDERLDPVKSADAAARYLQDSYGVFGDWSLAISSYNCGVGNVNKAIKRSGSREFWKLYDYLPRETRGYMPAFVGAMYAFTYYKEHGLLPEQISLPTHVDTFEVKKMLHFKQVEAVAGIPMEVLREMNPQYVHDIVPGDVHPYILRLPYKYSNSFVENEDSIYRFKADSLFSPTEVKKVTSGVKSGTGTGGYSVYTVKKGDTLGKIAIRYGVKVKKIMEWNNLSSDRLRIGQKLRIYSGSGPAATASKSSTSTASSGTSSGASTSKSTASTASSEGYTTYTVKSGDTLYDIAKNYPGVSAKDIMNFNGMTSSKIKAGQKLKIPPRQ